MASEPIFDYVAMLEEQEKLFHVTCQTNSIVMIRNRWCSGPIEYIHYCEHCKLEIHPSHAATVVRRLW